MGKFFQAMMILLFALSGLLFAGATVRSASASIDKMNMEVVSGTDWVDPLYGINFSEFSSAMFDRPDGDGSVTFEALGGSLWVRTVDQSIHADVLGKYAVQLDGPARFTFTGPECWGVTVYLGSDLFDPDRLPAMYCYAYNEFGETIYVGGDSAGTPFGPEATSPWPFQYLLCHVYRTPFPGYTPRPLSYCDVFPNGSDVFVGLIQTLAE